MVARSLVMWSAAWVRGLAVAAVPAWAWSAIAGLPEPPTPRDLPQAWFSVNDDMFGDAILDTDDFRTGNANGGLCIGRLVIAGDYSVLTHRLDPSYDNGTRSDELSLTIGARLEDLLPDGLRERSLLIAGIGTRIDGNLGGERLQNAIHRRFGFPQTSLTYDHADDSTTGLGYCYGSIDSDPWRPLAGGPGMIVQLDGEAMASLLGEFQESVGITMALVGGQGSAWIGCNYQWNGGQWASATAAVVAEHEAGPWLTVGLAKRDSLFISAGIDLKTHGISGSVGCALDAAPPPVGAALDVQAPAVVYTQQELEYFPGGGALGVQVRGVVWSDHGDGPIAADWACEWMLDYHFGTDQDYQWQGNRVDVDQALAGLEPECSVRPGGGALLLQPFVDGGAGARFERVKVTSAGAHRFDQATAGAMVVQGGGGVRMRVCALADMCDPHWYNLVWIGYGYDFWHPLERAQVSAGADRADYLCPGMGGHYLLGMTMAW